jgi:hypothetical protein
MKKRSLRIFLMFSVLAILSVSSIQAQSGNVQTANIPFEFMVGNNTFPAGLYSVTRVNPQSDKTALLIKSADGSTGKVVLTMPIQAGHALETAKLVFSRYDEKYFLSEVWTPADATGLAIQKSRSERTLLARNTGEKTAERVTIALNTRRR